MPDLNIVQLMGRLTFDPELRRIASGNAVTELRMAVNKKWKDKDGEMKEKVLFADVTFWGKQAEVLCQYLHKGSAVYVQGSLEMDQWDDKTTGEKRSKMKIVGDNFQFLDSKSSGGGGGHRGNDQQEEPRQARSAPPSRSGAPGQARPSTYTQREADEESIPF